MTKEANLSPTMTETQFDNGYWYAAELRAFAKEIGSIRPAGLILLALQPPNVTFDE